MYFVLVALIVATIFGFYYYITFTDILGSLTVEERKNPQKP